MTASESIDSKPPHNPMQEWHAFWSLLCLARGWHTRWGLQKTATEWHGLKNLHNWSELPMSFQRRKVREHGIYRRRLKKVRALYDGFRKHRFQASTQPNAGMTCYLKPALPCAGITYPLRSAKPSKGWHGFKCLHSIFWGKISPTNQIFVSLHLTFYKSNPTHNETMD